MEMDLAKRASATQNYPKRMNYSYLDKDLFGNPTLPERPKLSICLITYKHEAYIRTCLDNMLSQEVNFDYEIILGEDHSPDGTAAIIAEYASQHPTKIKAFIRPENVGGKSNFLHCFLQCRGEYVIFIEGDDYWTDPTKLQQQVDFLDAHPEASACFHNAEIVYEDASGRTNEYINAPDQPLWTTTADLLSEKEAWFMATASVMMRRKYVASLPAWFVQCKSGDIPMYVILAEKGPIGYLNKSMSVYRKNLGGQSFTDNTKSKAFIENRIFMYTQINAYTQNRFAKQIRRIKSDYQLLLIKCHENKGHYLRQFAHVVQAFFLQGDYRVITLKRMVQHYWMTEQSALAYLNFRSKLNRLIGK
jgi:glycosyltransferase involved in cell wall biosynthesis